MKIKRRKTRSIDVGKIKIGGNNSIVVQSMTKSKIDDIEDIKKEIKELLKHGCELIRIAVPDKKSIFYLKKLIDEKIFSGIPVVADIHFDYRLALDSMDAGVDCIRINPGNIGGHDRVVEIINKAKRKKAALRVGINSGSVDKKILRKNKGNIAEAMIESTLDYVRLLENLKFHNFKISAKASSVLDTIKVYGVISDKVDYPLHLGVTEAGPVFSGSIKSSVGMGILLHEGIGDTIRVSLSGKSVDEVDAGYIILNSLGLRKVGVDIVSCPTCGRTTGDFYKLVGEVEKLTSGIKKNLKIAIMGCIVNGPGEARDADLGIAFGSKRAAIFLKGRVIKRVDKDIAVENFEKELRKII
ncbi:MAG: flavodoxin-dependent (E)-4-hydroxy-3-methylbut-2-enyl-diphosphate synthase [Actinomycetota bacterium]|nr:flavodoxin-dependent (E)-4-hydroxy-3-methylbut-2-enyl-diphosphate synthase [Actinomycetota bacterium]